MEMASEKGATKWLSALPLKEFHFDLSKAEFQDALALRYGWNPPNLPAFCACGNKNSVQHAMDCHLGGFVNLRHNALRDEIAKHLEEAGYKDVQVEPELQPMPASLQRKEKNGQIRSTDQDGARLDISANGFWRPLQRSFFDVRVTDPLAPSYGSKSIEQLKKQNEQEKKRDYGMRVREIEKGSFSPLVFTTAGGCGKECEIFLKKLSEKKAKRNNENPSDAITHLRTTLSFTLLRSNTLCLRGSRLKHSRPPRDAAADPTVARAAARY